MRAFLTTVAILLALALAVSAAGEWDRQAHDRRVRAAAATLGAGEAVLAQRYLSERRLQTARLAVVPRPRVVAFGSSRVQPLSTRAVAGLAPGEFYNAGMAGASVDDYIAAWSTLVEADNIPAIAVFSIDAWVFNEALPQEEWREVAAYVERFLMVAGAGRGPLRRAWDEAAYRWHRAKEFLSWPAMRASVTALALRWAGGPPAGGDVERVLSAAVVPESKVGIRRAFRPDGSVMNDLPARSPARLRAAAVDYVASLRARLSPFAWNAERARRLEALWQDMGSRGVRVVAYLPPYHPLTWAHMRADPRYAAPLTRTARFLGDVALATGARFIDLSNPATIPCGEHEFFDADHPTERCLERIVRRLELSPAHAR
jgi:hypothetical protein